MAADQVVHPDDPVFGHFEADDPLVAAGDAGFDFCGGQCERRGQPFAHGVVVGERLAASLGFAAQVIEPLLRRVALPAHFLQRRALRLAGGELLRDVRRVRRGSRARAGRAPGAEAVAAACSPARP